MTNHRVIRGIASPQLGVLVERDVLAQGRKLQDDALTRLVASHLRRSAVGTELRLVNKAVLAHDHAHNNVLNRTVGEETRQSALASLVSGQRLAGIARQFRWGNQISHQRHDLRSCHVHALCTVVGGSRGSECGAWKLRNVDATVIKHGHTEATHIAGRIRVKEPNEDLRVS